MDMTEVCQTGIENLDIPSWCVEYSMTSSSILQGFLELIILILLFIMFIKFFNAFKRRNKIKYPPSVWEPKGKKRYKK
jgi:hypothetical protein